MKGTTIVVVLLAAMGVVLIFGLLSSKRTPTASSVPGQIGGTAASHGPPPKPGPLAGEYKLARRALRQPIWREPKGILTRHGTGTFEGSLNTSGGKPLQVKYELLGTGPAATGRLTADLNRDGKLDEKPVASVTSVADATGLSRQSFPAIRPLGGKIQTLGVRVARSGIAEVAYVHPLTTEYLAAIPPKGEPDPKLRFVLGLPVGSETTLLVWDDRNRDGSASSQELSSGRDAQIAGRLYRVGMLKDGGDKVTLAGYGQATGRLEVTPSDGRQIAGFTIVAPEGMITVPGALASAEVPAGDLQVAYMLPVTDDVTASASIARPVRVEPNQTTTLKVGGPVSVTLDASSQGGNVSATATLATQSGDSIRSFAGPGDHAGLVEVLDETGRVLASGKLEFG